jgi:hypothetical protein
VSVSPLPAAEGASNFPQSEADQPLFNAGAAHGADPFADPLPVSLFGLFDPASTDAQAGAADAVELYRKEVEAHEETKQQLQEALALLRRDDEAKTQEVMALLEKLDGLKKV